MCLYNDDQAKDGNINPPGYNLNDQSVIMQMSNNNGSSADIDSHISKKYEIRRRLGKVIVLIPEDDDGDNDGDTKARRL